MGHKDLRLGQIVYILVFYNISFSWLLPLDGFQFIYFFCVTVKTIYIIMILAFSTKCISVTLDLHWCTVLVNQYGLFNLMTSL